MNSFSNLYLHGRKYQPKLRLDAGAQREEESSEYCGYRYVH